MKLKGKLVVYIYTAMAALVLFQHNFEALQWRNSWALFSSVCVCVKGGGGWWWLWIVKTFNYPDHFRCGFSEVHLCWALDHYTEDWRRAERVDWARNHTEDYPPLLISGCLNYSLQMYTSLTISRIRTNSLRHYKNGKCI